uniref:Insect cytokine uENF1 n=1 Tax=Theretra japonica TaxID=644662 RepID=E1CEG6_9NEOP|nr:insect cytokine precursor uENF1 [Theretra japonica]
MTSVLVPIIVLSIVFNSVLSTSGAPFSPQDFLDIFGDPLKDFKESFSPTPRTNSTTVKKKSSTGPNSSEKMIDVPLNRNDCKKGYFLDNSGVCRQPW